MKTINSAMKIDYLPKIDDWLLKTLKDIKNREDLKLHTPPSLCQASNGRILAYLTYEILDEKTEY